MLHSVRALLALEKVDFKTHKGVINYFNQHYILPGKLPKHLGRIIALGEERRVKSDYDEFYTADQEIVLNLNNCLRFRLLKELAWDTNITFPK